MNFPKPSPEFLATLFLPVSLFCVITVFSFAEASSAWGIKIVGSFMISVVFFIAFTFRYNRMKEKLEKDRREKADSLKQFCHALRTPLTTVSGIAEIFEGTQDTLDSRQKELVLTLRSSTAELKRLITQSLDFPDSKIETP